MVTRPNYNLDLPLPPPAPGSADGPTPTSFRSHPYLLQVPPLPPSGNAATGIAPRRLIRHNCCDVMPPVPHTTMSGCRCCVPRRAGRCRTSVLACAAVCCLVLCHHCVLPCHIPVVCIASRAPLCHPRHWCAVSPVCTIAVWQLNGHPWQGGSLMCTHGSVAASSSTTRRSTSQSSLLRRPIKMCAQG